VTERKTTRLRAEARARIEAITPPLRHLAASAWNNFMVFTQKRSVSPIGFRCWAIACPGSEESEHSWRITGPCLWPC
jgi:hypothetical protein